MRKALLLLICLSIILPACGKKAPPKPPEAAKEAPAESGK